MSRSQASPRRWLPVTSLLVALATSAAACGARTAPYLGGGATGTGGGAGTGGQGAQGATSGGSAVTTPNGSVISPGGISSGTGGGSGGGGGSGASGGSGGSGGSAGGGGSGGGGQTTGTVPAASALTPQNFPLDPAQQAALCTGTAGNTASAPGVTATSYTFGNVSGLTGVLTNSFNQGPEAVQALFSAVNAAGGICGRQLKLLVEDDGQDATKNASDTADLLPKSLAFVGSTSDADNGGVPQMENANIADIGSAINASRSLSSVYWSATGPSQYLINGHPYIQNGLMNGLKVAGNFPKKLALLAYSIPISADAAKQFGNVFVQGGSSICFTDESVSPATASLDQDVVSMKNAGCDGAFTTMDVTGNAKLYQAMARQGFKPAFNGTTFDGYTPAQVTLAGQSAAQGLEVSLPFLPFSDNNPVMNIYLNELHTWEPGKDPSGFGVEGWANGEMMLYALIKAGRNPTRASLISALQTITTWNTGGATGMLTPGPGKPGSGCSVEVSVQGGAFVRKWPSAGYFCNSQLTKAD